MFAIVVGVSTLGMAGCVEPAQDPNSVAVDTGVIGRLMPGAYFLLSWPMAEHACREKNNRTAEIQGVKNGVAAYRCAD